MAITSFAFAAKMTWLIIRMTAWMWLRVRSFEWLMQMWLYLSGDQSPIKSRLKAKSCGNISYRCPVWSAAGPLRALCQQTLRDGCRRAPPLRTQVGRTRAAPPRTGSGFQCLWCLLVARSSSGRLYTARQNNWTWHFLQKHKTVRCSVNMVPPGPHLVPLQHV